MQATAIFWVHKYDEEIQRHDSLYAGTIDSTKSLLNDSSSWGGSSRGREEE